MTWERGFTDSHSAYLPSLLTSGMSTGMPCFRGPPLPRPSSPAAASAAL